MLHHRSIVAQFASSGEMPTMRDLRNLARDISQPVPRTESGKIEFKSDFDSSTRAWATILQTAVSFNNSGGGIIIFGVDNRGTRIGIPKTLSKAMDPATIGSKLRSYAPAAVIPTAYAEIEFYRKRYGFLLVGTNHGIIVFDKVGNCPRADGKGQETIFRPGVVYVRREGETAEARQADLDHLMSETVGRGVSAFLARIERVATLPVGAELLARQPGASQGYVLVSAGQGVPVTITQGQDHAVPLSEVMTDELPLAGPQAELVGQMRQWHADPGHRVGSATLARWYLSRNQIELTPESAKFCLLSALRNHGYSLYWASQVPRNDLRLLLRDLLREGYPTDRNVTYLIGSFLFSERVQLLDSLASDLPAATSGIVERLRTAPDRESYLRRCRRIADTFEWGAGREALQPLYTDTVRAQEIFDALMESLSTARTPITQSLRSVAHQLDVFLHADRTTIT